MADYFESGFCVRQPSWHGKENLLDEFPEDWAAARIEAGLTWEPTTAPVFVAGPHSGIGNIEVAGFRAITRDDTGEVLHVATDSYSLITHADMGDIIEAVLGADANVRFETAGSVRGGRQVWALCRLDEPFTVPGDTTPSYPYLVLLNSHDGSAACSVGYTTVRVVCWNTWSAADDEGARSGARHVFKHTGDVKTRIEEAKATLGQLRSNAAKSQQLFADLAKTPVRPEQVLAFTERFLPSPRDVGEQCTDRVHDNVKAARQLFTRTYETSPTTDDVRGTAYGLFMTATEYLDHLRGFRTRDSYLGRTILTPQRVKGAALHLLEEVVLAA